MATPNCLKQTCWPSGGGRWGEAAHALFRHRSDFGYGYDRTERNGRMSEFRLTQISDTHLARRLQSLTDNFHRVSEHIDATRPGSRDQQRRYLLRRADQPRAISNSPRSCMTRCRCRAVICPAITTSAITRPRSVPPRSNRRRRQERQNYLAVIGEDRWRFDAAGWSFIGLNSLIMNTGIESEAEQFGWLASELGRVNGRPVALFLHKPLYLNTPDDPETRGNGDPLCAAAPAQKSDRDVCGGRSAAGRVRPRPPAARLHLWPHPPCLGAIRRLHHS